MASVTHVENADGSHSLGVKLDGKFVPFVTVPADRVTQLVAQAADDEGNGPDDTDDTEGT
jgi:hypothetical protein